MEREVVLSTEAELSKVCAGAVVVTTVSVGADVGWSVQAISPPRQISTSVHPSQLVFFMANLRENRIGVYIIV